MRYVGKSKIGKLSAKGITYPQLRLPKSYSEAIGEIARIFETRHEGKQAFLIVTKYSMPSDDTVLKTNHEVLKPCDTVAHQVKEILVEDQADCLERSEAEKSLCTRIETFKSDAICPALLRCSLRESRSAGPIRGTITCGLNDRVSNRQTVTTVKYRRAKKIRARSGQR